LKIGIAGTGRMGAAIGQRLMKPGARARGVEPHREKTRPLAAGRRESRRNRLRSSSPRPRTIITILTDA